MIQVTHLDGEPFLLNAEWIRYVESRPDTFITLVQGDRIVVRESMAEVLRLCLEYQRSKHLIPSPQRTPPIPAVRNASAPERIAAWR
jgi:flagellar protein FlbD